MDDLRTRVAKAIAGPIVASNFGKREVNLRAGETMPPDGTSPNMTMWIADAYRHADAALRVLAPDLDAARDREAALAAASAEGDPPPPGAGLPRFCP